MSFVASFHGQCADCSEDIVPGQRIERAGDPEDGEPAYQHARCGSSAVKAVCVCERCFLVHAGACF